jgi:hypothetical protein
MVGAGLPAPTHNKFTMQVFKLIQRYARILMITLATFGLVFFFPDSLAAQSPRLAVTIVNPAERETLYASPDAYLYSVFISGWITTSNPEPTLVQIRLEIFRGSEMIASQTGRASSDGSFSFSVEVNPGATEFNDLHTTCPACHFPSDLALPRGRVRLRVIATDPAGTQAVAERNVIVDRSDIATVPVRVIDADSPAHAIANVAVAGSTRLYLWRARYTAGTTDVSGQTQVRVEALSQSSTRYVFRIEPTIVDGVLYQGIESQEIVILPGQARTEPVILRARSRRGEIAGTISSNETPRTIFAIDPASGMTYRTQTNRGAFAFHDLPITRYVLTTDPGLDFKWIDLTTAPSAQITTTLDLRNASSRVVRGKISAATGEALPFAWVTTDDESRVTRVTPASGEFVLSAVSANAHALTINAPGYWSQVVAINNATPISVTLDPRPEMRKIARGNGEILLPPETVAELADHRLTLTSGWVWGQHLNAFVIETLNASIAFDSATFAIERVPGKAWLYVMDGTARVTFDANRLPVTVNAGQMLALDPRIVTPQAAPLDPLVVRALSADERNLLNFTPESSFAARVRDTFNRVSISVAQLVTFATYLFITLAILGAPLVVWALGRRFKW